MQGLLHDRVVEGQAQHLADGQAQFDAPADAVGQVLALGADHLRAQQAAAGPIGVDPQQALGLAHGQGAADRGHADLTDDGGGRVQLVEAGADGDDVGVAEDDGQRGLAAKGGVALAGGVVAGDLALIPGLVKDGSLAVHVAGDIDRQVPDAHGAIVKGRQAAAVQGQAKALQPQAGNVGGAADAAQHLVDHQADLAGTDPQLAVLRRGDGCRLA